MKSSLLSLALSVYQMVQSKVKFGDLNKQESFEAESGGNGEVGTGKVKVGEV